ncbi:hypothetical protein HK097_009607 [Rhizophlyctis rosea]|uniref:Uncharacterized protein n=1 Tax=Rhizophlyctis rosea TaxID=64517 RepID=A0AAD5X459_9FUNG|nr:hypothetical protein HK097_009607 [Rhizophlyctis rosea]
MTAFELKAVKFKSLVKKNYDLIPEGLPRPTHGGFAFTLLGKRKSGKTNLICNMILSGYAKAFDSIIILNSTVFLDPTWESLKEAKRANNYFFDKVTNFTLLNILQKQKETYLDNPKKSATLLVLDDAGNFFCAKEAKKFVDISYSTARQYNCSILCSVQSVNMLTGLQLSNTQYWAIWSLDGKASKKIADDLSYHLTPRQFEQLLQKATQKKYEFLYVYPEADEDKDIFKRNFTEDFT